jgi:uncharacterized OB-fold protein
MAEAGLEMSRCRSCHAEFLPRPGPCPRCGSAEIEAIVLPARGTVRAATELSAPAAGWTAPHRLVLLEISEGIRLLGVADGPLPAVGAAVQVVRDGAVFRVR